MWQLRAELLSVSKIIRKWDRHGDGAIPVWGEACHAFLPALLRSTCTTFRTLAFVCSYRVLLLSPGRMRGQGLHLMGSCGGTHFTYLGCVVKRSAPHG